MKYDIITFGSATRDVFLESLDFLVKEEKRFITGKGICFPFPAKVDIKKIFFATGGGGTNTAVTFANQGLKVAYCGKIGKDAAGKEILKDLARFKIDRKLVLETDKYPTNYSLIFSFREDRTVFVYKGASQFLQKKEIPWKKLKTSWFYLAPLSGKLIFVFDSLVNFAEKNNIRIFANLGNSQIILGIKKLKPLLKKIDILLLNQEEASLLTKIPFQKEKKVFEKLEKLIPGIAIMTKGKKGAVVSDGTYLWQAKSLPVQVTEKTGAGDAFGAGFLANFIKTESMEQALQFGIANAVACMQKIGAKQGLLKKGQVWRKVKVTKKKLG